MRSLFLASVFLTLAAPALAQNTPVSQAERDRRDIQMAKCIDQVATAIVNRNGAPRWAARVDALRWCEQNMRY